VVHREQHARSQVRRGLVLLQHHAGVIEAANLLTESNARH
jgi:hypothetical protein